MGVPAGISPSSLPGRLRDLVRVPIDFVLEVWENGELSGDLSVTLPNGPSMARYQNPGPVAVTYTLGPEPIREHTPFRQGVIECSGRSGVEYRSGYNRNGQIIYQTGPTILNEFEHFLRAYQERAASRGVFRTVDGVLVPDGFYLVFRDLRRDLHAKVEILDWQPSSAVLSTTTSYEWSLRLEAYAPAEAKRPGNLFAPADAWAQRAADAIALANAAGALLDNALRNTRSDLDALRAPLRELRASAGLAQRIVASTQNLVNFPRDVLSDVAYVAEGFALAVHDAEVMVDETTLTGDFGERMRRLFRDTDDAARQTATAQGALGGGPAARRGAARARAQSGATGGAGRIGAPARAPRRPSQRRQALVHRLQSGETLRGLARRFLGDPERWREIALHNGLIDGHRWGDGRPLRPGDQVQIPGVDVGQEIGPEREDAEGDVFGRDLYLNPATGDLEILGGDLRTVRGADNLTQALRLRLLTAQGHSGVFPRYGLPVVPGDSMSERMRGYVAAHVRAQVTSDPRIRQVREIAVLDEGDRLSVEIQVEPISGTAFGVIAPLSSAR